MSPRRVWAVMLRHGYLIRDSPARILPMFVWVAVDIVLWGFISKYLTTLSGSGRFVPGLLGAVLLWDFCARVIHGVSTAFLEDVWSRNFLNLFASPLRISEYLTGLVLTTVGTSLVGLVAMLLLACGAFGLSIFPYGVALIPFLLLLFAFGIALGIVACAVVLRYGPAAEWFVWPIPAVLSPFTGVFYPLATLPVWMQWVAHAIPASWVFEGVRTLVNGGRVDAGSLLCGGALALVYLALACAGFSRVYAHAVRTGLIARYSAESLN